MKYLPYGSQKLIDPLQDEYKCLLGEGLPVHQNDDDDDNDDPPPPPHPPPPPRPPHHHHHPHPHPDPHPHPHPRRHRHDSSINRLSIGTKSLIFTHSQISYQWWLS